MSDQKRLIVVLGMHRSGTSAVTRGLEVLGAGLGDSLEPAMEGVNEKGFFEDTDIVSINESVLKCLGLRWSSLVCIHREDFKRKNIEALKTNAIELLQDKIEHTEIFAVKDPRISILLPFWQDVFQVLELSPSYILVVRNPLSIVDSLHKRDAFPKFESIYLWLRYVTSILENINTESIVLVDFDRVMLQPGEELMRIANALDLKEIIDEEKKRDYEEQFLDKQLRHSTFSISDLYADLEVPEEVSCLYDTLYQIASDSTDSKAGELQLRLANSEKHLKEMAYILSCISTLDQNIAKLSVDNDILTQDNDVLTQDNENTKKLLNEYIQNFTQIGRENESYLRRLQICKRNISFLQEQQITLRNQLFHLHGTIANLQSEVLRLSHSYQALFSENQALIDSTSWKLTQPIRSVISKLRNIKQLCSQRLHRVSYNENEEPSHISTLHSEQVASEAQDIEKQVNTDILPKLKNKLKLAVHIHIEEFASYFELIRQLEFVPQKFDVFITYSQYEEMELIESKLAALRNVENISLIKVEGLQYNLLNMFFELGKRLVEYECMLHINLEPVQATSLDMAGEQRYLLEQMLGNEEHISLVLNCFAEDKSTGIFYPSKYRYKKNLLSEEKGNFYIPLIISLMGKDSVAELHKLDAIPYLECKMFWCRTKILKPVVSMNQEVEFLTAGFKEFDLDLNAALASLLPYFAQANQLSLQTAALKQSECNQSQGTLPIERIELITKSEILNRPVLIYDHNFGGGTNQYTKQLISDTLSNRNSAIRVYYNSDCWFVEWISHDEGLLFSTYKLDELLDKLNSISFSKVIVNSFFGFAEINNVVLFLDKLIEVQKIELEYKVHDFYALCPSPHLLDHEDSYCNVPSDLSICRKCIAKNNNMYVGKKLPKSISEWRKPFELLLNKTSVVDYFDSSSIEIFRRCFKLDADTTKVTPHKDDYFPEHEKIDLDGPLHVGVIGTMTHLKGLGVINRLSRYISQQQLEIPITIVGSSHGEITPEITVTGEYDVQHLPEIIRSTGVNVVLLASIIPETFSFTASEVMKMELPIVTFDLGAQGSRVKRYPLGKVIPLNSRTQVIIDAMESVLVQAQSVKS